MIFYNFIINLQPVEEKLLKPYQSYIQAFKPHELSKVFAVG